VYWVRKVPKDIAKVFDRAYAINRDMWLLRGALNKLISDTTDRLSEEISTTPEFENMVLSPYPFYITNESGGGQNPLYISWMWQRNLNAREYADDFAKNSWGKGAQWKLQTQMNPKGGGPVKVVG